MTQATRPPGLLRLATIDLSPAYFALVMATGIISIAAHMHGMERVAMALFVFNCAAWVTLWLLHGLRLAWFTRRALADASDHARGPGYFTWVASTGVLGTQFVQLAHDQRAALILLAIAMVLWLVLTYGIFTALLVKQDKPSLAGGINGSWLLAIVATQSIAVLAAQIAGYWPQPFRLELNFLALSMWLWGGMLYIWMIALIFYRYYFFRFSPGDLSPPFWISMGAMAISTLAGALLVANSADSPWLTSLLPFLKSFTVFYWVTGTWWIPMLILLGVWRHVIRRFPLRYNPLYWGAVFPLGMYAVGTGEMAQALDLKFLQPVPEAFTWIALLAWALAMLGLASTLVRAVWLHAHGTSTAEVGRPL